MKKAFKIFGITLISLLFLLLIIPYLLPKTISNEVKKWVNQSIKGEVEFESTSLSFFRHFPSLTFSLHNFTLKGSAPFQQDTLLHTKELSFGVDLSTVFSDQVKIEEIFVDEADINIEVDEKGNANYNVYESKDNPSVKKDSSQTAIKIQGIFINKSNLVYNDRSIPMMISAKGLSYAGEGDLSNEIFDLKSKADIDTINVYYNKTPYLLHKSLNAKLVTKINTNSLDLLFNENDLKINSLPIRFKGKFSFLKDGYDINFKTQAKETDLHNIFSALPPEIASRMEKTNIKGYAEIKASLIGKYNAKENIMPTAAFSMKIRDGEIMNPKAPEGITNLYLNLQTKVPGLNPDSLYINMDSLYFNIGSDYVNSIFKLKGIKEPEVHINTRAAIDLDKWSKIFGMEQLRGRYQLNLQADGKYTKKVVKSGLRQVDTVISTIPKFRLKSTMKDGYFKYAALPTAIDKINFHINGSNTDGQYKNTVLEITDLNIQALSNYIRGHARIQTAKTMPVDIALKSMSTLQKSRASIR
ncbi:membrane spanning protein, required for outer membrane integrity [Pedobacter sp. BAL39]|uniref:AsmA family protein n=1 Tax=Pedobacter sp. BAL39 TaxID=391596 RepID=UPI000155950B|nr:AsmA family protein [Pedobacter sp. BAL39]EDM36671.1 membrane spanning protein, required for outer membrane integrity [Pedobacter sp. BAL39]